MYNPFTSQPIRVERNLNGDWFTQLSNGINSGRYRTDEARLTAVMSNPAFLKVVKLLCDTFSLGKIEAVKNNKIVDNDALIKKLNYPNFFQSQRQFLWDYMFWTMLGTSYLYTNDKLLKDSTQLYFLMPNRLVWTDDLIKKIDTIVLSKQGFKAIEDLTIQYNNLDGKQTPYKLGDIKPLFDLSNGAGHWYKGDSSVDALYKIICNSELGLDAKSINMQFASKFLVNGTSSSSDVYDLPMTTDEANHATQSILGGRNIQVIKSQVDIKRYVDNLGALKLDEQYWSDYFAIGTMYNIPRELLETYNTKGAAYENQEKALGRLVEMGLNPKGSDLMDAIERRFGYDLKDVDLRISWEHLSFMQVFRKTKNDNKKAELDLLQQAVTMGVITQLEASSQAKIILNG